MKYPEAQLLSLCTWALRDHAVIVSGAYKLSKRQQGREPTEEEKAEGRVIGWRDETLDEKLEFAVAILTNRCQMISELIECIGEEQDDEAMRKEVG